jgi:hypothetical protein
MVQTRSKRRKQMMQEIENKYEELVDVIKIFGEVIDDLESYGNPPYPEFHKAVVEIENSSYFDDEYLGLKSSNRPPYRYTMFFRLKQGKWYVALLPNFDYLDLKDRGLLKDYGNANSNNFFSSMMVVNPKLYFKTILKKNPAYFVTKIHMNGVLSYYSRAGWKEFANDPVDKEHLFDRQYIMQRMNRVVRTADKHQKPLINWARKAAARVRYHPESNLMKRKFEEWGAQFENERSRLHTPPRNTTPAPSPAPKRRRLKVVRRR